MDRRSGDEQPARDPEAGQEQRGMDRRSANPDFSWLTALGFCFLTFNSGMAIYRAEGDPLAIALVSFSYVDLILLFVHLRYYEQRERAAESARRNLKVAVWVLTTLLTLLFSYKVAAIMPPVVAILVWIMAFTTLLGGFYAFFIYTEKSSNP
ncbi:unnamed protein product [Urochloa humidicola]